MNVTAVVVSRMDHPLGAVLDSILPHVEELIVVRGRDGVWERWEAAARAKCDVVYTQDDDCIVNVPVMLSCYTPDFVTCNMPMDHRADYPDGIALVGWGCVFSKDMLWGERDSREVGHFSGAFEIYADWRGRMGDFSDMEADPVFRRECDRVFTGLSPLKLVNVQRRHIPQAHGADRMGCEPRHGSDMREIRRRIYAVRGAKA